MTTKIKILLKGQILSPFVLVLYRALISVRLIARFSKAVTLWYFKSREFANFTYDLTENNKDELVEFLYNATGCSRELISGYLAELESDTVLRSALEKMARGKSRPSTTDAKPLYGRRLGWYALVRILEPKLVVESGVDKGLGTSVLACAVKRNQAEGHEGRIVALDINPKAGALIPLEYRDVVKLEIGDSLDYLADPAGEIGLFIHDSNHAPEFERKEYELVHDRITADGAIVSDNAHATTELLDYSRRTDRRYSYWGERPLNHFYAGAGIGLSLPGSDSKK